MDIHEQIVEMVERPDWKAMILDTVKDANLDPWDLDISLLTQKYLEKINSLRSLDFRVPANAVFASAILVRFKSDSWVLFQQEDVEEDLENQSSWEFVMDGTRVPELNPSRRITRRPVTIKDLISAVEHVMDKERKKIARQAKPHVVPEELMTIAFEDREDYEKYLEEVHKKILEIKDGSGLCLFSQVIPDSTRKGTIRTLIPILHLATQDKIVIWQESVFDEIFISVN